MQVQLAQAELAELAETHLLGHLLQLMAELVELLPLVVGQHQSAEGAAELMEIILVQLFKVLEALTRQQILPLRVEHFGEAVVLALALLLLKALSLAAEVVVAVCAVVLVALLLFKLAVLALLVEMGEMATILQTTPLAVLALLLRAVVVVA